MNPGISFLISTLGQKLESLTELLNDLSKQSFRDIEVVIVAQLADKSTEASLREIVSLCHHSIKERLIVSETVGLTKSRNIALAHGTGDILLLCDDDCRYHPYTAETIVNDMGVHPEWDIVTFRIASGPRGPLLKEYPEKETRHNARSLMKVSSVEIAIRKRVIKAEGQLFDERYGLGTQFITGAENVMLFDLYQKRYCIGYIPSTIVYHPPETSGHGIRDVEAIAFSKGAMFRRMFGIAGAVPAIIFFLKKLLPGRKLRFSAWHIIPLIKGIFTSP